LYILTKLAAELFISIEEDTNNLQEESVELEASTGFLLSCREKVSQQTLIIIRFLSNHEMAG
jgi:hypothetical protein